MKEMDWEKRWEKYILDYSNKITLINKNKEQEEWLVNFLKSSVVLTSILFPAIITFVKEFKLKSEKFNGNDLNKKLYKFKRKDVESTIKLFLMDYFATATDNPHILELLANKKIDKNIFENKVGIILNFDKKEKELYKKIALKKDTFIHGILFFEKINLKTDAKNEALLEGLEMIKGEAYDTIDKTLNKFIQQ
jgi:hypothetical protein